MYVDVHAHLTDARFAADLPDVLARARAAGLGAIVVNGLCPATNAAVVAMAARDPLVQPATGIYPIDAVNALLPADFQLQVARFDVDAEIAAIRARAAAGQIVAVGECGLDGHWVGEETFAEQERVFLALLEIAVEHDLPAIIHTRKREERAIEIIRHHGVKKVDFHCYGGRVKSAVKAAQELGAYFSIPANARVNEAFRKMLTELPPERILTETDCPYLAPKRGERNEPANVVGTVALLAEVRGWEEPKAAELVIDNYRRLFGEGKLAG
jgi:TatD DNase family protein